ncbi:MAG: rod shape-determining protein MreC [Victivallales bacterium]|nr:rod shape-determining protein MreC [Victivallales bacterium]
MVLFFAVVFFQAARKAAGRITADFYYPFVSSAIQTQKQVAGKALLLESKVALAAAVEDSEKYIQQLTAELATFRALRDENRELRHLLDLKEHYRFKFVFAEIIIRDPAAWERRFTINRGSDDGIATGDCVVTGSSDGEAMGLAVVGRIGRLSHHSAEVITLVGNDNRFSIRVDGNGAVGVLDGGFRRGISLYGLAAYLPRDLKYEPGMKLYTSGLSRTTPAGLYIGRLSDLPNGIRTHNNLYTEADVELGFDLNLSRFVMVITGGQ